MAHGLTEPVHLVQDKEWVPRMAPAEIPLDLCRFPLFQTLSDASNQALLDGQLLTRCEANQLLAAQRDWGESL